MFQIGFPIHTKLLTCCHKDKLDQNDRSLDTQNTLQLIKSSVIYGGLVTEIVQAAKEYRISIPIRDFWS